MAAKKTEKKRTRSFRVTRTGWYFLAMMGFVVLAGRYTGVNILYFGIGMMAGAMGVGHYLAGRSLRHLTITRDFGDHVVAGDQTDVIYSFRNEKRLLPAIGVHFRERHEGLDLAPGGVALHLPPTHRGRDHVLVSTRLRAARRGILRLRTIELTTTFPFGLVERFRDADVPQEMIVYPRIGMLNRRLALEYREAVDAGAMTANRRGGNDEFYGVREYRSGDNLRAVHWRSTARQGTLMIKEMAANAPPQLIIVLNLREMKAEDTDAAERAIELAAALVCYGFYENFAIGLAIAGLKENAAAPEPRLGREIRSRLLRELAILDTEKIDAGTGILLPNHVVGRAQWVIVTLHRSDRTHDLLPAGAPAHLGPPTGGHSSNRTVLAIDDADAGAWMQFLSPEETLRLLRERDGS